MSGEETIKSLVFRATLAEHAERFDDMVDIMKQIVLEKSEGLVYNERNLLSMAYKNAIGTRRMSWRAIGAVERKTSDSEMKKAAGEYKIAVEKELKDICSTVKMLLDEHLIPKANDSESKVFYQKMKGDYCRYEAEFTADSERDNATSDSKKAYEEAMKVAEESLPVYHPLRLGLALNYSVFYYEILEDAGKACSIAKTAFDDAVSADRNDEETFKDSTLILQLLRDNLTLWNQETQSDEVPDAEKDD